MYYINLFKISKNYYAKLLLDDGLIDFKYRNYKYRFESQKSICGMHSLYDKSGYLSVNSLIHSFYTESFDESNDLEIKLTKHFGSHRKTYYEVTISGGIQYNFTIMVSRLIYTKILKKLIRLSKA